MILHEDIYLSFIGQRGVGKKDRVSSSPNSYLSYLRQVARALQREDITPQLLKTEQDVLSIAAAMESKGCNARTVANCKTAMRHYVAMVQEYGF